MNQPTRKRSVLRERMERWVMAETRRRLERDEAHVRAELARLGISEADAPHRVVLQFERAVGPLGAMVDAPPRVVLVEDAPWPGPGDTPGVLSLSARREMVDEPSEAEKLLRSVAEEGALLPTTARAWALEVLDALQLARGLVLDGHDATTAPTSPDEQLGFDRAPDRYAKGERETIDRIRDVMTDREFIAYCRGTIVRYLDRAGPKGPSEVDERKAVFYREMAAHVRGLGPDPRQYRDGFEGYQRQPYPAGLHDLLAEDPLPVEPVDVMRVLDAALVVLSSAQVEGWAGFDPEARGRIAEVVAQELEERRVVAEVDTAWLRSERERHARETEEEVERSWRHAEEHPALGRGVLPADWLHRSGQDLNRILDEAGVPRLDGSKDGDR